jgi:hypothetical protein
MTNSSNRISCRGLFKELGILPLCSQYILSLALFVAKNMDDFIINSDIHPHGESNGKLPLSTCPECGVSEPYQSPDRYGSGSCQNRPKGLILIN